MAAEAFTDHSTAGFDTHWADEEEEGGLCSQTLRIHCCCSGEPDTGCAALHAAFQELEEEEEEKVIHSTVVK